MNVGVSKSNMLAKMNISHPVCNNANAIAAFICGVRFFAYSVFYYFYFKRNGKINARVA